MSGSVFDIPLTTIDGQKTSLAGYKGKTLLIVNVASECGLTSQYESLQKLYETKHGEGLEILAFPCNDFGAQEPGTPEEIKAFCSLNYKIGFPLFAKIIVNGKDRHPLYKALIEALPTAQDTQAMKDRLAQYDIRPANDTDILWNFEKFVIDRKGNVIARLSPDIAADDERLLAAVEKGLHA